MRRKPSGLDGAPPSNRLRLTILLATVAAFLLVPAAQAFANGHLTVDIKGVGEGEVNSTSGSLHSFFPGSPPIECAGPPATGVCEDEMTKNTEFGVEAVDLNPIPFPGSEFVGWKVEEGFAIEYCKGNAPEGSPNECLVGVPIGGGNAKISAEFGEEKPTFPLTVEVTGSGEGSVSSKPVGISCGAGNFACSHEYAEGTEVTLTAKAGHLTPAIFTGWSGGGCSGTGTCKVTMSEAKSVSANFTAAHVVSVKKEGTGSGTVTSSPAGINCGGECSAVFATGSEVTLSASPEPGSTFTGWSGEGCSGTGTCKVTVSGDAEVTATFEVSVSGPKLTVAHEGPGSGTVVSNPAGIVCASGTCEASFEEGKTVVLTASPAAGSMFSSWKGCDVGGANGRECKVTMSAAKKVSAKFIKSYSVAFSKEGPGLGKVQSSPGGVLCLANCLANTAEFKEGTTVKLSATPSKHFHLVHWTGDCSGAGSCELAPNANYTVGAEFAEDAQFALSLTKAGGGNGTVKANVAGINCGTTCPAQSANYYAGTVVTLTATPGKGSVLQEWTGACSGTGTCTVTMNKAEAVGATFE